MSEGYRALRERAAWLDLSGRGKIVATGEDRARLLHAMSTNRFESMQPGSGVYCFFLNAQGQIQADANGLCFADRFLLDTEPETRERLLRHLDKYIIADDVMLEDATGRVATLAIEGPHAEKVLRSVGAPAPRERFSHADWSGITVQNASATGGPGWRLFVPAGRKQDLVRQLESAGAVPAGPEEIRTVRLEHGIPRYGEDIQDTTLPQESRQMHAVHFAKGCYLGQEIVERIRARGHANRLLVAFEMAGNDAPAAGATIEVSEREAGAVTSAVFSPALGKIVGLAYVRAAYAQPGTAIRAGGRPALVSGSPSAGA